MPPKKIALISDAWDPQVNGVVTTFKNIIPLLNKKGFDVEVLHPEMFSNFSYPWYKEIKFSYNTKNVTNDFFTKYDPDIIHLISEGPVGFAGNKISLQKNLKVMDASAIALARDNNLPIIVFSLSEKGGFKGIMCGEGTFTVVGNKSAKGAN